MIRIANFIKGIDLCESFFGELAFPIINKNYPDLKYSATIFAVILNRSHAVNIAAQRLL